RHHGGARSWLAIDSTRAANCCPLGSGRCCGVCGLSAVDWGRQYLFCSWVFYQRHLDPCAFHFFDGGLAAYRPAAWFLPWFPDGVAEACSSSPGRARDDVDLDCAVCGPTSGAASVVFCGSHRGAWHCAPGHGCAAVCAWNSLYLACALLGER